MLSKILLACVVVLIIIASALYFAYSNIKPNNSSFPKAEFINDQEVNLDQEPAITTVAENLTVPWALAFLPDGRLVFTERPGRVNILAENGEVKKIATINVHTVSESGLHGVAVDPNFEENNNIYLYYTYQSEGNNTLNRVSRYTFDGTSLNNEIVIVDQIPGAPNHDGGRIKFGPDGYLYITTGDAQEPTRAQDRNSLAGKILRVAGDGTAVPDNPFNTRIFSYGHRNPQGITFDDGGALWATEHGRSGVQSGFDELNKIEAGKNYGWPDIEGDESASGVESPVLHSGGSTTWAPGGAAHLDGSIFFTGLRGQTLYEYKIAEQNLVTHLASELGRIRDVAVGSDGLLYISTSNRDGRGNPDATDDKILRINPNKIAEL